jgi:hypothetical protein
MADTPITISKLRVSQSENPERLLGYTHKFNVKYSDIACGTGNADTVTLTLGTTPTNWLVSRAIVNVVTAFAGTTSFVMIVGTTTGTSAFIASVAVQTAGLKQPSTGANTTATIASSTGSSAVVYKAIFTNATGGSPSALTAGELNIYLNIIDLDQMP